jgi:secernin
MCDVLVALAPATADGVSLFAKNSDRPPAERQLTEWSPARHDIGALRTTHIEVEPWPRPTLAAVLSRPAWCWGAEHGVNEAGVAVGNTTVYTTLDPRGAALGLTGMDLVRLALERAASAHEAVDVITSLIARYGQGGSGHDPALVPDGRPYWNAFLVADPSTAFVIDTSGPEWAVEAVDDVRAISNRTTIPAFDEQHRHPRQPVDRLVDPRWHASQRALAARPVTVGALQAHLRSHDSCGDPGWSVCMHVEGVEHTTASMIAELLPVGGSRLWVCTGNPCASDYTSFTFEEARGRVPVAPRPLQ